MQRLTHAYRDQPCLSADPSSTPSLLSLIGCVQVFTWIPCGFWSHREKSAQRLKTVREAQLATTRLVQVFRTLHRDRRKIGSDINPLPPFWCTVELLRNLKGEPDRWLSATVSGKPGTLMSPWLHLVEVQHGSIPTKNSVILPSFFRPDVKLTLVACLRWLVHSCATTDLCLTFWFWVLRLTSGQPMEKRRSTRRHKVVRPYESKNERWDTENTWVNYWTATKTFELCPLQRHRFKCAVIWVGFMKIKT